MKAQYRLMIRMGIIMHGNGRRLTYRVRAGVKFGVNIIEEEKEGRIGRHHRHRYDNHPRRGFCEGRGCDCDSKGDRTRQRGCHNERPSKKKRPNG